MVSSRSKKTIHIYELLAGLFVMTLIVSNIASVKMVSAVAAASTKPTTPPTTSTSATALPKTLRPSFQRSAG